MRLSKSRWPFSFSLSFLVVALAPLAPAQEKGKEKADQREKVTLQYRIAWDAFAPSKFVAVIDGFITLPLKLSWDLAKLEDQGPAGSPNEAEKGIRRPDQEAGGQENQRRGVRAQGRVADEGLQAPGHHCSPADRGRQKENSGRRKVS